MFTGIVEEIGKIKSVKKSTKSSSLTIEGNTIFEDLKIGDSVAVNGVCLTVTDIKNNTFMVYVMSETLNRSSLGKLKIGSSVNLERAIPTNGRFGGHIVSGHIDGIGVIVKIERDDKAIWYTVKTHENLMQYIVLKGSIALDGISLTVSNINNNSFSVSIIPHTSKATILSEKIIGDTINIENDIIGKYIEKFMYLNKEEKKESKITKDYLLKMGF